MPIQDAGSSALQAELTRLQGADPFRVLKLSPQAEWDAIRHAYLEATKRYHPNRYAREPREVRDLAHEVFLLIRRAYDQLADEGKRKAWQDRLLAASRQANAPPRPSATAPAMPPPANISSPTLPAAASAPVPPSPSGPTLATASGKHVGVSRSRPITRPPEEVQAMLEAAKTRNQRFDDAQKLIMTGRYQQARLALQGIAGEDPHTTRFRVQLHLAWGLEHKTEGRVDEAIRELERAVLLDSSCREAAAVLQKLQASRKGTGLFSKWFGR